MNPTDAENRTVDALKSQTAALGVWGCGHIGASAMYHFSRQGVRCVGYDIAESRVMGLLYADRPRSEWPPIGSIKPIYGHLLGAAGIVNAAATSLMIYNSTLVPTINYDDPDPTCDLDYVPNVARDLPDLKVAVSNSFGFGGHNASIVVRRWDE